MTVSTDLCRELYRLAAEHNGENLDITLSGVSLLVLQDFESAQHVLRRNSANYEKNMPWFRQALGPSRMTENGPQWRFRQMLSQSHLARFDRQRTFELCLAAGERTAKALIAAGAQGTARIEDNVLREMAASVMLESLFERSLEQVGVDIGEIAQLIAFGSEYAFAPQADRPVLDPDKLRAFLNVRAKVLQDLQSFRRDQVEEGSLLARLKEAEAEPGFVLEHELTLFFAAGAETTAASMGWALYLLARNPDIQEELQAIVDALWSRAPLEWSDLEDTAPLETFVGEVLRIFPATPVVGRQSIAPDIIGTRAVEAGRQILVSLVGVQHQHRMAPERARGNGPANTSRSVDPWHVRWHQPSKNVPNSGQSFSFGVGPRVCAGARFALVEMMAFVAAFLRFARFEPTAKGAPEFRWQSQLLHEGGQPVRLVAR